MKKRRAETRKGMVVTTVALPEELHRRLVVAALEERAASAELIRQGVREYLDRLEVARKRGKK